jgi:hypothetical protein
MVRGLVRNWKQPVYIEFDQKMTKNILNEIIQKVHNAEYTVVAVVCDCGPDNLALWNLQVGYGITPETPYFTNPADESSMIYWFPDVPHLLKNLRNHFIDAGFHMANGDVIDSKYLRQLIQENKPEISSIYKLNEKHLVFQKVKRQNVRLAANVFSHTVATVIKRYFSTQYMDIADRTADLVQTVDSWFSVMNSYTKYSSLDMKCGYGTKLEMQNEILDRMYELFSSLRCRIFSKQSNEFKPHTSYIPFQKGILISVNSLKGLYENLKTKYNLEYILTHRLNQVRH